MKQTMKHLVSFLALIAMMVSLCSAMVFPAAAASEEYATLLNTAFVVNPAWSGLKEGTAISYQFRGEWINDSFNKDFHFSTFAAAQARAEALNLSSPVILLTAGVYTEDIKLSHGLTLLGPNAGKDPNYNGGNKNVAWTQVARDPEAVLECNISIVQKAIDANVTIDGITFGTGSAYLDYLRTTGSSELTIKNTIFATEGNTKSQNYVLFLRSEGHSRVLRMENIYVSGYGVNLAAATPAKSFIAPYFTELYVSGLAYVNNPVGFLAKTWFANGVAPVIEISSSCFFNDSVTPAGYVISVDNAAQNYDFISAKADVNISNADGRPSSLLQISNTVFHNASASAGLIHYEFINKNSVINLQNNYIYSDTLTTVVVPEYLIESAANDQTNCFIFHKNVMINSYKIPTVKGAGNDTYINMSYNYFGDTNGKCIYNPVYADSANGRLLRTEFYVTPDLTRTNLDCQLSVSNWPLVWVDNENYTVDIIAYEAKDIPFAPVFNFGEQYDAKLYKAAHKDSGTGAISGLTTLMDQIKLSELRTDTNNKATIYLNAQPKDAANTFSPSYTVNIEVIGNIDSCKTLAEAYPGYYMYHPMASAQAPGVMIPFHWDGVIYRTVVGQTLFGSVAEIIADANAKGIASPTIVIPAGVYTDELLITGSCTILGAQHGVNPNVKPYDILSQDIVDNSKWTLNPARANDVNETLFKACLRVSPDADDYVITVDGIKMGANCSYVDDISRNASNVTILKNILADGAGGGLNRSGAANTNIFNFNKQYGVGSEYTTLYMYDIRVVNVSKALIGPLIEKLVVDGLYISENKQSVWDKYRSRDVESPYFAWTNCYFGPVGSGTNGCFFNTNHHINTNLTSMKNIVYFWDNNVFYHCFPTGGYINCQFTGTNMTVYVTNNTVVSDHADSFFNNTATLRMHGDCKTADTSNMIVMKGNHMINYSCITRTYGIAVGTMWDFSGNYYANNTKTSMGLAPKEAYKVIHNAAAYTLEDATRVKIDYTFLDWEMTQRSDAESVMSAEYNFTKNPEKFNKDTAVYTDTVAGNVTEYLRPYELGEFSKETIYLDTEKKVTASSLDIIAAMKTAGRTDVVNFYVDITSLDAKETKSFTITLNRTLNNEAEVLRCDDGLIGVTNIDVTSGLLLYYHPAFATGTTNELSLGAKVEYYKDEMLTDEILNADETSQILVPGTPYVYYLVITAENGVDTKKYSVTVNYVKNNADLTLAGVTAVEGMNRVSPNAYEATVSSAMKSVTVSPIAYRGSNLKVIDANGNAVIPVAGAYELNLANAGSNRFTLEATAGNNVNKAFYSLTFNRGLSNDASILSIPNARKTKTGYVLNFGLSGAGTINAEVAPGATYEVFYDYACTQKCENGVFVVDNNENGCAYIKVTSEDGSTTNRAKVVVLSQAGNVNQTVITAKVGEQTYTALATGDYAYTIYLPAGVTSVAVQGKVQIAKEDTYANFFADPSYGLMLDLAKDNTATVKLDQKKTTVYVIAPRTIREATNEAGDTIQLAVPERRSTLYLISDRSAVSYKDANQIAEWAKPYVNYMNDGSFGILKGDENGYFNGAREITRYEIATISCRVLGLDVTNFSEYNLSYADTVVDWAKPYVQAATSAGLMAGALDVGTGKINFAGSKKATRQEVMKVLVSLCMVTDGIVGKTGDVYYAEIAGEVDMNYKAPDGSAFADEANVAEWARPYVHLAVGKYGMINGEERGGKHYLNPSNNITRAEVAKMVACYLGYGA